MHFGKFITLITSITYKDLRHHHTLKRFQLLLRLSSSSDVTTMGSGASTAVPDKYASLDEGEKAYYQEKFTELTKAGKTEDEAIKELAESKEPKKELDPYQDLIMDPDLAQNRYPKEKIEIEKTKFAEGAHCSLMARTITEEMFERYKDIPSGGLGNWTLARAMNTGVQFPRAYMGIHAGDPESYDTFIDLYKPCVEGYHHGFKWDPEHAHRTDLNPDNITETINEEAMKRIVSTRVRVARNLGPPFVMNPNGNAETRNAVLDLVREVVATLDEELTGTLYEHAKLTKEEEQRLIDEHFLFKGRDMRQAACGYHQNWPAGRGIFQAHDKQFNMWINEGDHLRIVSLFQGGDIVGVVRKLSKAVSAISEGVAKATGQTTPFAQHPILGMITCCPTNLGTGCRASVFMDVPKLIKKLGLHGVDAICAENHCQARGSTGEFSEVTEGARIDISNKYRLGYSEIELINQMIKTCNMLALMEKQIEDEESAVAAVV